MLWTIADSGTGYPVLPYDCNPDAEWDEGMLVYLDEEAAAAAANHQMELYDIECRPQRLTPQYVNELKLKARRERARVKRVLVEFNHKVGG